MQTILSLGNALNQGTARGKLKLKTEYIEVNRCVMNHASLGGTEKYYHKSMFERIYI